MKKNLLSYLILFCSFGFTSAQWQKMDLTKTSGGTIDANVYQMALKNNKLYAATADGIFESASANGGDWVAAGLQGKKVFLLNFDILQLALTIETAADDATKRTLQLYKRNGEVWENTGFNASKLSAFGTYPENLINFAQIQNNDQVVIVLPTWGNGIWRSVNSGLTWSQVVYEDHPTNGYQFFRKIPAIYTFAGDNVIYGTDKADFNMQYLIRSTDFGATWQHAEVANFFNPWSFHKRKVANKDYFYWAGKDGNQGVVWRSEDAGLNWDASLTAGVEYWDNRRIIGEDDGPLYVMSSVNNVYVSNDNGDSFLPVGTGIIIPATKPAPAGEPLFLTHLVKSDSKLYVSTYNDGIYSVSLILSALNTIKSSELKMHLNQNQTELTVSAESGSEISIYSVTGKLLKSQTAKPNLTNIAVNDLNAAVYIVKVISANGNLSTNRFVKK